MAKLSIEGQIIIEGAGYEVEYEPSAMAGASTLFLRVAGNNHNVPIFIGKLDTIIDMLERGRAAINALENNSPSGKHQ